jgi:single-strand DNA-binding protein
MNSFALTAVGNLAKDPEMKSRGNLLYTRFCLVGNEYAGKDIEGNPRESTTSVWFVAFGPLGETLALHARKGDQIIVTAHMRATHWTDQQGEKRVGYSFVAQGFRFGAPGKLKREEFSQREAVETLHPRPSEVSGAAA